MEAPEFFDALLFWHWWALAVGLLVLEALLPGAFFLWMAVAAGAVGVLLLMLPGLSWEIQLLVFSIASVIAVVGWLSWIRKHPRKAVESGLNQRGNQYIGQQFSLTEGVIQGRGKLQLDDTIWIIAGPDCPAGSRIKITAINGSQLLFEIDTQI